MLHEPRTFAIQELTPDGDNYDWRITMEFVRNADPHFVRRMELFCRAKQVSVALDFLTLTYVLIFPTRQTYIDFFCTFPEVIRGFDQY
jgi:hypothetical protein